MSAINAHYLFNVGGPAFFVFVTVPMSSLGGVGLGHEVARQLRVVSVKRRLTVTTIGGVAGIQSQSLLISSVISPSDPFGLFINRFPIAVVISLFAALAVEPLHRKFGFS